MTRKTNPETKGSEAQKGLQKVVPKEPPGHVRDTHLFTLSRPRRAAVSCKFRIGPWDRETLPRCTAQGAGCVSCCDRGWERRQQLQVWADGQGCPPSRSLPLAAEGLRQGASLARRKPRCSAARMLQCGASATPTGARSPLFPPNCLPPENVEYPPLCCTQVPFPLFSSPPLGSHPRISFLSYNVACKSITT